MLPPYIVWGHYMLVLKKISALVLGLAVSAGTAQALTLQQGAQPAEFPPASYTADVYVDSRGCIYIRAGFSGAVTWVPRVSRARQVVCGAQPSLSGGATQATTAPIVAPVNIPVLAPAPVSPVAAAPVQIVIPATAPALAAPVIRTPVAAAAPVAAPVAPAPSTAITRSVTLTCPIGGSNTNVRASGVTLPLRCAAGQVGPITYIVAHTNGARTRVTVNPAAPVGAPVQVIAPPANYGEDICANRSALARQYTSAEVAVRCGPQTIAPVPGLTSGVNTYGVTGVSARPVVIPAGYSAAWDDGRLNPNRGPRTELGDAQMNQVWTQTVPRRLVTAAPVVTTARARAPKAAPVAVAPVQPVAISSGYIQVAMFGVPANAQKTVTRLQGMGLPVSVGNISRSGKSYQIVMAGPFTQQAALNAALAQVRGAGFGDAYIRR